MDRRMRQFGIVATATGLGSLGGFAFKLAPGKRKSAGRD